MASTTRRTKMWCWCGDGWAQARSRPRVTRLIRRVTRKYDSVMPGHDERESGVWDERLGRSAHRARDGKAARNTARADRGRREADRLEGRPRRTARDGAPQDQGTVDRLHDAKIIAGKRLDGLAGGQDKAVCRAGGRRAHGQGFAWRR